MLKAGTGKSTLVRFIIEALDVSPEKVAYVSFTGKAAEVLRKKGNPNATTMHKLLYESVPRAAGGFIHRPKPTLEYTIVVVDEVSMVPKTLIDELFRHKVYVICLGDPYQLPVINKDEDNHLLDSPHIFLEEIMRQAMDSEIIRLTMQVREGRTLNLFNGNEVKVLPNNAINQGMLLWGDQVIVGTNTQRILRNQQIRQLLGKGTLPEVGDKLICLSNYWETVNLAGNPLTNGSTGIITSVCDDIIELPPFIAKSEKINHFEIFKCNFESNDNTYLSLEIDKQMLLTGEKCCDWRLSYKLGQLRNRFGELVPKEFAYGYAITCHKAQGSEWDKVLVLEETFPFAKIEHSRWLYTAATRATSKLVIVKPK